MYLFYVVIPFIFLLYLVLFLRKFYLNYDFIFPRNYLLQILFSLNDNIISIKGHGIFLSYSYTILHSQ